MHLDDDDEVFFCSARDITERKKAEENLRIAATAFDSQGRDDDYRSSFGYFTYAIMLLQKLPAIANKS